MPNKTLKLTSYEQIKLIHNAHLPGIIGVGIAIDSLKENEKPVGRCVPLVKGYGVLDSVSI